MGIWEIRLVLLQGHARLLAKRVASRAIEGDNRYTGCLALSGRRLARFVVGPSSHDHGSFIEVVNWKSMSNIRARGYLISSERFVVSLYYFFLTILVDPFSRRVSHCSRRTNWLLTARRRRFITFVRPSRYQTADFRIHSSRRPSRFGTKHFQRLLDSHSGLPRFSQRV